MSGEKKDDPSNPSSTAEILRAEEEALREAEIASSRVDTSSNSNRSSVSPSLSQLSSPSSLQTSSVSSSSGGVVLGTSSMRDLKKHNTTKGLIKDEYPVIGMEVNDENWDDWYNNLLAYGHANDCVEVIFDTYGMSLAHMISTFGSFFEETVIVRGHKMVNAALYQKLLQTVNKSTGKEMNEALRLRQVDRPNELIHFNVHELYLLIKERYGKKNELVEILRTYRALHASDVRYSPSESPDKYRSLVMGRIQEYNITLRSKASLAISSV